MKFIKKLFHKHILKTRVHTVYLRGRLSDEKQTLLGTHKGTIVLTKAELKKKVSNNKDQKIILEIGFGNGSHIIDLAQKNTNTLVVGVEMYREGLVKTLEKVVKHSLKNIVLLPEDAREVLKTIPKERLSTIYVLFPDPWPKKKHNKRRLLKKYFFEELLMKLKKGGEIVVATDWSEYADEIGETLTLLQKESEGTIFNLEEKRIIPIKETTFAKRAQKEGREIYIKKFIKAE